MDVAHGNELTRMYKFRIFRKNLTFTQLKSCFLILNINEKLKLSSIILVQVSLNILDLVGIAVLGLVASLSVAGIQSRQPSNFASQFISSINLESLSFQNQVGVLGLTAVFLLLIRSAASIYFNRRIIQFFSIRNAIFSNKILTNALSQGHEYLKEKSKMDLIYGITHGTTALTLSVLAATVNLISDFFLLVFIGVGLTFYDPVTAISLVLMFSVIIYAIENKIIYKSRSLGAKENIFAVRINKQIEQIFNSFKELYVANRLEFTTTKVYRSNLEISNIRVETTLIPNTSKYLMESGILIIGVLLCLLQITISNSEQAVSTLTIFLAATTRLTPAILRIQQGTGSIRNNLPAAMRAIDMYEEGKTEGQINLGLKLDNLVNKEFNPNVKIVNLKFKFDNAPDYLFSGFNHNFEPYTTTILIGKSGSGKSTLLDFILGIKNPNSGEVLISGVKPKTALANWQGQVAFVPQDVNIFEGTIEENLSFGYARNHFSLEELKDVVKKSNLTSLIERLPDGFDTEINGKGISLSGGERQRLGLARALLTKPKVLILDEITSSLDKASEEIMWDTLNELKTSTTIIIATHKIPDVKFFDATIDLDYNQKKFI